MVRVIKGQIAEAGLEAKSVHVHPAQSAAWELAGVMVTAILAKKTGDAAMPHPSTMGGIPMVQDFEIDMTFVEFRNGQGETIARIECLPILNGFFDEYERKRRA